jgi:hypothetical protein
VQAVDYQRASGERVTNRPAEFAGARSDELTQLSVVADPSG